MEVKERNLMEFIEMYKSWNLENDRMESENVWNLVESKSFWNLDAWTLESMESEYMRIGISCV